MRKTKPGCTGPEGPSGRKGSLASDARQQGPTWRKGSTRSLASRTRRDGHREPRREGLMGEARREGPPPARRRRPLTACHRDGPPGTPPHPFESKHRERCERQTGSSQTGDNSIQGHFGQFKCRNRFKK
jgi:hypothetical protein